MEPNKFIKGWNEALNKAERLQAKEALSKRVTTAITAAGSTTARTARAKDVADAVADGVALVYERWAQRKLDGGFKSSPANLAEFSNDLVNAAQADLSLYLRGPITRSLKARGLLSGLSDATIQQLADQAASEVLSSSWVRDLFQRLHGADNEKLGLYTGINNARNRATQFATQAAAQFEESVYNTLIDEGKLTGARRWKVADPQTSRNAYLNGQIAQRGEKFRTKDGKEIWGPNPRGGNPKDWSNERSILEYQTVDGRWI